MLIILSDKCLDERDFSSFAGRAPWVPLYIFELEYKFVFNTFSKNLS